MISISQQQFDILVFVLLAAGILYMIRGWSKGFMNIVIGAARVFCFFAVCIPFSQQLADKYPVLPGIVWFFIVFVLISLVLDMVKQILRKVRRIPPIGWLDRIAGLVTAGFVVVVVWRFFATLCANGLFANGATLYSTSIIAQILELLH